MTAIGDEEQESEMASSMFQSMQHTIAAVMECADANMTYPRIRANCLNLREQLPNHPDLIRLCIKVNGDISGAAGDIIKLREIKNNNRMLFD